MNLKEAFRYQNKLDQFIAAAQRTLGTNSNILTTENTYLRAKAVAGAENETIVDQPPFEHADKITELTKFTMFLIEQREKLYTAIRAAKASAPIDIDSETSLNNQRQAIANTFRNMLNNKSQETIIPNGGTGYTMNNEGNQVQYRCDIKRVTKINFDRNAVQSELKALMKKSDEISAKIDETIITTSVDFEPQGYDVNDTFDDAFDNYLANN